MLILVGDKENLSKFSTIIIYENIITHIDYAKFLHYLLYFNSKISKSNFDLLIFFICITTFCFFNALISIKYTNPMCIFNCSKRTSIKLLMHLIKLTKKTLFPSQYELLIAYLDLFNILIY